MTSRLDSGSEIDSPKPLLAALRGQPQRRPPIWLMRQAGRYLPEYRRLRAQSGGFLAFCHTPELAKEATLHPIRRFGMDGAILFSDILVVPDALGQPVRFDEGSGPRLDPVMGSEDIAGLELEGVVDRLAPIYETVRQVRDALVKEGFGETTLIGFAGGPWTVATYMVEGGSSKDFARIKAWADGDPDGFQGLIDLLVEATVAHLRAQIEAGVEAVQLFDSWAGALSESQFARWVSAPTRAIVERLKQDWPRVPVIGFPRGAGQMYLDFRQQTGVDALSLDSTVSLDWAARVLQPLGPVQGNLDSRLLMSGGPAMEAETRRIVKALSGGSFVFNLGHGVLPETPVENVASLVEMVRGDGC